MEGNVAPRYPSKGQHGAGCVLLDTVQAYTFNGSLALFTYSPNPNLPNLKLV